MCEVKIIFTDLIFIAKNFTRPLTSLSYNSFAFGCDKATICKKDKEYGNRYNIPDTRLDNLKESMEKYRQQLSKTFNTCGKSMITTRPSSVIIRLNSL